MKTRTALLAPILLLACVTGTDAVTATELLTNPDLEIPVADAIGDPVPTGWTLDETVTGSVFCPPGGCDINTAQLELFAAHSGSQGLFLRAFEGSLLAPNTTTVNAFLSQTVPGTPGLEYSFSGWSLWETNYSGGVSVLDAASPSGAIPSPTDTYFEMQFLGAGMNVLGSVLYDLRTGQMNDNTWRQHVLTGVAPAGTANVMVLAYATDMAANVDPSQSAFFDDFSLTAVPVPAAVWLFGSALLGLGGIARRRQVA